MKNANSTNHKNINKKIVMFVLLLTGATVQAQFKQNAKLKFSMDNHVSGNTHGSIYSVGSKLAFKANEIELSALLQKRALSSYGVKLAYEYMIVGPMFENSSYYFSPGSSSDLDESDSPNNLRGVYDDRFHVGLMCFVQYLSNAKLSYNAQRMEEHTNRIEGYNWGNLRMNTIDLGLGVQIKRKINSSLLIKGYLAPTFVYHANYVNNMHHENLITTLTLGLGFEFN